MVNKEHTTKLIIEEEIDLIVEQVGWGRYTWQGIGQFQFIQSAIEFPSPAAATSHAQEACSGCVIYELEF